MRGTSYLFAALAVVGVQSACAVSTVALSVAAPERSPAIEAGTRVRLWCESDLAASMGPTPVVGTFVGLAADSIVLTVGEPATYLAVPLAAVSGLEVRKDAWGVGPAAGTGMVVGMLVGLATGATTDPDEYCCVNNYESYVPFLGTIGGAAGFLIGAIMGLVDGGARWEEIPLTHLGVNVTPQRGGRVGIEQSVTFSGATTRVPHQ